ncbi:D-lactate dehydrogenase [Burkholderiales bacterium GJ-E10]|nr:D-lactate dehydrogenase [Burkholderiales bacterium GJ-E10]
MDGETKQKIGWCAGVIEGESETALSILEKSGGSMSLACRVRLREALMNTSRHAGTIRRHLDGAPATLQE